MDRLDSFGDTPAYPAISARHSPSLARGQDSLDRAVSFYRPLLWVMLHSETLQGGGSVLV